MARQRYALVLSGGGFKGAYQVGALKYIMANGIPHSNGVDMITKFDIVAGVSVGALNGAIVATNGMTMDGYAVLEKLWDDVAKKGHREIYESEILDVTDNPEATKIGLNVEGILKKILPNSVFGTIVRAIFDSEDVGKQIEANFKNLTGLTSNAPLLNKLKALVSRATFPAGVTYRCGVVSLTDGQYYSLGPDDFDNDNDLRLAILSSAALPLVWPPTPQIKTKDGRVLQNLTDGGVRNITPLGDVISLILKEDNTLDNWNIIVINCNPQAPTPAENDFVFGIADVALRVANDLTLNEIFQNDLQQFTQINELISQVDKAKAAGKIAADFHLTNDGRNLKKINIKIIEPNDVSEVGDTLDSSKKAIQNRFKAGFLKAELILNAPASDQQPWT